MRNNNYYYISVGKGSIYYTLREVRTEVEYTQTNEFGSHRDDVVDNDYYIKNLSTNKDTAILEAKLFSQHNNISLKEINGSLIVTGKIGDLAKEKELAKEKINAEKSKDKNFDIMGRKKSDKEYFNNNIKRNNYPNDAHIKDYESFLFLKEGMDFYSNPIWSKIRKVLFSGVIGTINRKVYHSELPDRHNFNTIRRTSLEFRKAFRYYTTSGFDLGFIYSMYDCVKNKKIIRGRALDIVFDIYAKEFGRRNSKAYNKIMNELDNILQVA